jgi:O-methyltransferase domain
MTVNTFTGSQSDSGPSAARRLTDLADYVVPFTLRAVCELGVADHLAKGPRSVEDLARLTHAHAPSLCRALRALACRGIFTEARPGVFDLTPLAQPLRSDHPESLRDAYPLIPADIQAWAAIDYSLRTGQAAFDHVHGKGYFEYMAEHPHESARFDASQQAVTRREVRAMSGYDWGAFHTIVDVGGGNGAFLAGLLARHPSLRGTVFDRPHVVVGAHKILADHGVADRCEVVGGSFFDSVPAGADAYLLKRIMFAWNDEQSVTLLRAVRAAMHDSSRLLLVEPVLEPGDAFNPGKLYDVLLLVMAGGGARSTEQLEKLFAQADLKLVRVVPTRLQPIVEASPVLA